MATAYLLDDRFLLHDDWEHPENASRLRAIRQALQRSGILAELVRLEPRYASIDEVVQVHHLRMLEHVQRMAMFGGGRLNPDTYLVQESWDTALLAAGAVLRAVEAVLGGEVANAFALVRPPGHHATPSAAMGFCLINNVAVAARAAIQQHGLQRVAIIDWDTHHGNGTQDIFYDDPAVLYVSSHTYPFYPGSGHWREMGTGAGLGTTLNLPLPFHTGDAPVLRVYEELVLPAVRRFAPQLIIVSAGYDCHWRDPLAPMLMSVAGYAQLAAMIYDLAAEVCEGRLVCALEGGYDLEALAAGVLATLRVLQGRADAVEDPLGAQPAPRVDIETMVNGLRRSHPLLA
ncbi:histone deacetylase [Kallotenue papyrolyticum]|uniref:histone deacetylase family protein n=1 Tax=Kallotenue papyrolyticum TaxID=1325125 RepID=UPI0004785E5E|nr:histone deacetylase [Kallotenue papyrolyticum]